MTRFSGVTVTPAGAPAVVSESVAVGTTLPPQSSVGPAVATSLPGTNGTSQISLMSPQVPLTSS